MLFYFTPFFAICQVVYVNLMKKQRFLACFSLILLSSPTQELYVSTPPPNGNGVKENIFLFFKVGVGIKFF